MISRLVVYLLTFSYMMLLYFSFQFWIQIEWFLPCFIKLKRLCLQLFIVSISYWMLNEQWFVSGSENIMFVNDFLVIIFSRSHSFWNINVDAFSLVLKFINEIPVLVYESEWFPICRLGISIYNHKDKENSRVTIFSWLSIFCLFSN